MKNKKNILILFFLFLAILSVFFFFALTSASFRSYVIKQPLGKWFLPSWHSLKKGVNIVHLPYWFKKSELPIYYLSISANNLEELRNSIPFNPETLSYGDFLEDNKNYANAFFTSPSDGYRTDIKIRYRGLIQNNWDAEKKAYRIRFPKDNLFEGKRAMNLFLPDDRGYFVEPLNSYRAEKLGLFSPQFEFVKVDINSRDYGVYLAAEPWSKELLARNDFVDANNIFSNQDIKFEQGDNLFSLDGLGDWKSYTAQTEEGPFEELKALMVLVDKASDAEFAQKVGAILDLEKFYKWQVINVLAGSNHQGDTGNTALLFRQEDGKFEYLPWDVNMYPMDENFYQDSPTLVKRILSNKKFFDEFNKVLKEYISNPENLEDDLAYYDNLYKNYKPDFYKDQTKIDTDLGFNQKVKNYRELIIANFEMAKELVELSSFSVAVQAKRTQQSIVFDGSFKYFNEIFLSIDDFLTKNPQFSKVNDKTVSLKRGSHVFNRTVIVPQGLRFVIEPGTRLLFAPRASLISYSPVTAVGTADSQIFFGPLVSQGEPWGVFGIINIGKGKNYFNFIKVSGGSEDKINGVPFLSQFSLRNTDSEIANSVFENGRSDDALHAIRGSVSISGSIIRNTGSDGIDFDYVKNSKITNSFFMNDFPEGSNGDGIDLSGTENVEISGNKIINFGDKCISIGEDAQAFVKNNILVNCGTGIAVKDNSESVLDGNIVIGNKNSGISLFRKKQEFIKGGHAFIANSVIWGNQKEIEQDDFSFVQIKDSTIKEGYTQGENINLTKPDFKTVLPAFIFQMAEQKL